MNDWHDGGSKGPGKWSEKLIQLASGSKHKQLQSLGDCGEEVSNRIFSAAQDWITRFTVAIGVPGTKGSIEELRDLPLGSGVTVRLKGGTFGLLTAGHVLNRGGNTPRAAGAIVVFPSTKPDHPLKDLSINLKPRPCTAFGFNNTGEEGPDLALMPLTNSEWSIFDRAGMVAYNLEKERWSSGDMAKTGEMNPWLLSVISGVRNRASQILQDFRGEDIKSIVLTTTNTFVGVAEEVGGYDYLELPSERTEFSFPAYWNKQMPGAAAQEIEKLEDQGVTQEGWAGMSGAGVWNLAVGTNKDGHPSGKVLGELVGICFFAKPEQGCIIAHGIKSIGRIAAAHAEREAFRYLAEA